MMTCMDSLGRRICYRHGQACTIRQLGFGVFFHYYILPSLEAYDDRPKLCVTL